MLTIRPQLIEAFQLDLQTDFETRVIGHLRRQLAEQVQSCSGDDLRSRIRSCMARSKTYGLESEYEVLCFVDASYLLGEHFDRDPALPWAAGVLGNRRLSPEERAELLLETACDVYQSRRPGG